MGQSRMAQSRMGRRPPFMGRMRAFAGVALLAALAACSTMTPSPGGRPDEQPGGPPPVIAPPVGGPTGASPASLPGWNNEDHLAAFLAYVAGCGAARDAAGKAACARGRLLQQTSRPLTPSQARSFFEQGFIVVPAETADGRPGMLTAYFAPEYPARRYADRDFDAPILAKPADLERTASGVVQRRRDGSTGPYPERAAIEAGGTSAQVLGWMRTEDLFFLQIQGSGYLTFEDGGHARAAYAADNGRPFTGIARPMEAQGLLPANGTSGDAIRGWLASHRGPQARAITALNARYIFFDLQADDGGDPAGAASIPLPARRAIAVDPASWAYGDLVWIEADAGNLAGARASYRGLVVALDTGSAIRGPVRADLYVGRGEAAGAEAGSVRHPLRMWRLVPRG